jgi:hypothetical protein
MSYRGTVCKLTDLKQHPNADRLQVANALGYYVIVGLDTDEDTLGVVFPSDGRLSEEFCLANNLYRKHPVTNEPMGGYFEHNGRIKVLRLRGSASEAFWTPLDSLSFTGTLDLEEGDEITEVNGVLICEKYYTPATRRAMKHSQNAGKRKKKPQDYAPEFLRHFDTPKLREVVSFMVGQKRTLEVTEKLHGTSGRTGCVKWTKKNWWQTVLSWLGLYKDEYRLVSGTRKVVLDPDNMGQDGGYYAGTEFRFQIHQMFEGRLREGEVVYYEIVGYTDTGSLIMGSHGIDKTTMREAGIPSKEYKRYGEAMQYTYSCEPGEFMVFIYRITLNGVDLDPEWLGIRAMELGLAIVPYLGTIEISEDNTVDDIMLKVEAFTRGASSLDARHIKEGVCLRTKDETGIRIFKYKGFLFCLLEGIRKNQDDYVDLEEVS